MVLQRALSARVSVAGEIVGSLNRPGLVALAGFTHDDDAAVCARMARKCWELRIFDQERSAAEMNAPILAVSQFTLYANTRKGRRPSWNKAAPGPVSEPLMQRFVAELRDLGAEVSTGIFGAEMAVELVNHGPVTIILDSADWTRTQ